MATRMIKQLKANKKKSKKDDEDFDTLESLGLCLENEKRIDP